MGEAESVPVAVPVPVVLVPSGEAPSGLAVASARIFSVVHLIQGVSVGVGANRMGRKTYPKQ